MSDIVPCRQPAVRQLRPAMRMSDLATRCQAEAIAFTASIWQVNNVNMKINSAKQPVHALPAHFARRPTAMGMPHVHDDVFTHAARQKRCFCVKINYNSSAARIVAVSRRFARFAAFALSREFRRLWGPPPLKPASIKRRKRHGVLKP